MSGATYYQRNKTVILQRAKDYYHNNIEALRERARNKYRELSEKEKDVKRKYKKKIDIITCLIKKTRTKRISKKLHGV